MAKNWWEDEGFSEQMLALGMGLLQGSGPSTDPANRSFGSAVGKGGMAMLAQMQQQKQNKMNERRIGMEEKTVAMKQQELEQKIAAAQTAAEQQRVFRGRLVGAPADFLSSGGNFAGGPPLKVSNVPEIGIDHSFEAMLTPPQRAMLASMPMDKAAAMAEKLMTPSEMKFYSVPGKQNPVALRQLGSGVFVDTDGSPVLPSGIAPYEKPSYVTVDEGAGGKAKKQIRIPANQAWEGKPYESSGVNVNMGNPIDNEMKLRKEFQDQPEVKAFAEVRTAWDQISTALKNPSAANDLAAGTKFMKILDPNSVVRESELGMAMAATGLMDRVSNYHNLILKGEKLTPSQRADFYKSAEGLYKAGYEAYKQKEEYFRGIANDYKFNPDRIVKPFNPSVGNGSTYRRNYGE